VLLSKQIALHDNKHLGRCSKHFDDAAFDNNKATERRPTIAYDTALFADGDYCDRGGKSKELDTACCWASRLPFTLCGTTIGRMIPSTKLPSNILRSRTTQSSSPTKTRASETTALTLPQK
jgi:hypothetical protein